jgi:glycosyltransferase involved in cell wall biosynthesis
MMVSVIVPVFNRLELLLKTIDSILNQSFSNFELILVDDFSTTISLTDFEKIEKLDPRIKVFKNKRKKGAPGARNTGLIKATGNFIIFFDSDNLMKVELLEKLATYLSENKRIDAVSCCSLVLNDNSEIIDAFTWKTDGNIFDALIIGNSYADTNSVLYKREALEGVLWDENVKAYQELDFNLCVASNNKIYSNYWDFLVYYYRWANNTISSDLKKDYEGKLYIFLKWKRHYIKVIGRKRYYTLVTSIPTWRFNYFLIAKQLKMKISFFQYFILVIFYLSKRIINKIS